MSTIEVLPPAGNLVDVEMTDTAWAPVGKMGWEQWEAAGRELQRMGRAVNFWLADWVVYGEQHFGEMYSQAIDLTGLEYQTIATIVWVAKAVEPSRRRETLSWSHHEVVAALPPAEQDKWLQEAEVEGYTRNRLRSRLNGTPKTAPDPDEQIAPTHIARVTFRLVAESDEHAHQKVKELAAKLERLGVTVTHKKTDAL